MALKSFNQSISRYRSYLSSLLNRVDSSDVSLPQQLQKINIFRNRRFGLPGAFLLLSALALAAGGTAMSDYGQPAADDKDRASASTEANTSSNSMLNESNNSDSSDEKSQESESMSTSVSSETVNGQTHTSVNVNGQNIAVPKNGSRTQTINTSDGQATVTVNNSTSAGGDSDSHTYVNSNTNSHSSSSQVNITHEFRSGP